MKDIILNAGFKFNKNLGQNFISDKNLLDAIVSDSGVNENDVVVEIGTGGGTLTRALSAKSKRVFSFEVDKNLKPVLDVTLAGVDNVEVVFKDVLKMSDEELKSVVGERFKLVANLPYYITTPLIMRLIESELFVETITVMVQKEVADRLVANVGSKDHASISLAIRSYGEAHITRTVKRDMFFPKPNVDSAVVKITLDKKKLDGYDKELVHHLIRAAFAMRRKTLVNNLSVAFSISKDEATKKVTDAGFAPLIRGEALSLENFLTLSRQFEN